MSLVETPRVSVVMSVYNGARYLREAVDSVLAQTFQDFEFIIVDDGSTDETPAILDSCADPRLIRLRNEQNAGVYPAVNRGLSIARGEYIARHDADDISLPERLAWQVAFLDAHDDIALVGSQCEVIDEVGRHIGVFEWPLSNTEIQERLLEENCIAQGAVMIRRTCLQCAGLYDETFPASGDYDLWLRMAEQFTVANLPDVLYRWRAHPDGLGTRRRAIQQYYAALAVQRALTRQFGQKLEGQESRLLAWHFAQAGLAAAAQGEARLAQDAFAETYRYHSGAFEQRQFLELMAHYAVNADELDTATFVHKLMGHFPRMIGDSTRLCSKMVGQIYATLAFVSHEAGKADEVRRYVRLAVQHDASWLLNRGVRSIWVQTLLSIIHR